MGRRSKYPEEFRRNAAELLVLDGGRSVRDVARELGVNYETLRDWGEALRRERCEGTAAPGRRTRAGDRGSAKSRGLLRLGDRPVTLEMIYGFLHRGEGHLSRPSLVPCPGREPVGVLWLAVSRQPMMVVLDRCRALLS